MSDMMPITTSPTMNAVFEITEHPLSGVAFILGGKATSREKKEINYFGLRLSGIRSLLPKLQQQDGGAITRTAILRTDSAVLFLRMAALLRLIAIRVLVNVGLVAALLPIGIILVLTLRIVLLLRILLVPLGVLVLLVLLVSHGHHLSALLRYASKTSHNS